MKCGLHTYAHTKWHTCLTASWGVESITAGFIPEEMIDFFGGWPNHMIDLTAEVHYFVFQILKTTSFMKMIQTFM